MFGQSTLHIPPVLENINEAYLLQLVAYASVDPMAAKQAAQLQKQVFDAIEKIAENNHKMLKAAEKPATATGMGPMSVRSLRSIVQKNTTDGDETKDLAVDIVINMLANRHNPSWNVFDPSTDSRRPDDGLMALLEAQF